jgi:hypothetical protein
MIKAKSPFPKTTAARSTLLTKPSIAAATVIAFILGVALTYYLFKPNKLPSENSTVLLEKIQAVSKLITVEGQFSEIYDYNEYQGYFTFLWNKKILVRVKATVSVGYDLQELNIQIDSSNHIITMSNLGTPEILSIDHNLDYYDISNGLFTSFTSQDYNRINQKAKELIREQALKSELFNAAKIQGNAVIQLIKLVTESSGWTFEISEKSTKPLSN